MVSFSKPYGLFYYRVGFTFCREPIPALYANKWFKNVYGLLVAEKILNENREKIAESEATALDEALSRAKSTLESSTDAGELNAEQLYTNEFVESR